MVNLDLICGPADKQCAKFTSTADGWDVVFYTFKFFRVVIFYTLIALMCSGWSFLRPFLQVKEKIVVMIVILVNVVFTVIRDTNSFHKDRQIWVRWDWEAWFFQVDNIWLINSLLILILSTGRWLDKACGKSARRSFAKTREFTWLAEAPPVAFLYFFIWRVAVSVLKTKPGCHCSNVTEEIFSLVFCMVMFYMFRPVEKNEYFFLYLRNEVEMPQQDKDKKNQTDRVPALNPRNRCRKNPDQVSFSYPKLPEDFEW